MRYVGREMETAVTANQNGEFTLWNGAAFNFEGLIAAHNSAVRSAGLVALRNHHMKW